MLRHRIYYHLKPYLPWRLRMAMRRVVARSARKAALDFWPVNEDARKTPAGWPGWPAGKKFALVLTHDVEGVAGLNKCRQLMQLEKELGFRSSFNFIPEGEYLDSPELRQDLVSNGFEVGVHDLRHDGKLYWKRDEFSDKARSINQYLKSWNATGFRPGFMLHNSDCLDELESEYDASAVDTDPFEPDPWIVDSIFPFWVPRTRGGGYVELPYTLPQDSTLFLVLQEKSPEIWKRKLDWIVRHGGMALMDTHPDYLCFKKGRRTVSEYPVEWYAEFLNYVRDRYAGQYWNPLPRDLARWYKGEYLKKGPNPAAEPMSAPAGRSAAISASLKGKRAAVVLYSYYESDPRPRREAEALKNAGMEVDVICLRKDAAAPRRSRVNGVNVFHAPLRRRRAGKLVYIFQYGWFLTVSLVLLSWWSLRRRYQLVHVHNMPDFLVFSALVPRCGGAKIILDLHDPMPELFQSIYGMEVGHAGIRLLKKLERLSIGFADLVLTPNMAFKQTFAARSCPAEKIQTIMNSPVPEIFNPDKFPARPAELRPSRPFVLMYHGLLVERHGLDVAIRAVARLREQIPAIELHLYGEPTEYSPTIENLIRELRLEKTVFSHGYKTLDEIAGCIAKIDLGLVPNRLSVFTAINFPTRIFEYLAMKKPVIVPHTQGIGDYFQPDEILYFEPGNVADLAEKIAWAHRHPDELLAQMERGRRVYLKLGWNLEEQRLLGLVSGLLGGARSEKPVPVESRS